MTELTAFDGWEDMDRNNALNLTEKEHHLIENYGWRDPGDCICGHRLSHHCGAAFGRGCDICGWFGADLCVRYTSARGVAPFRRLSVIQRSYRPPSTTRREIDASLDWQREKTAKLVQEAIERIWRND